MHILKKPDTKWKNYQSVICNPIKVNNPKTMKLIKRGWKNIDKKKQNIELQFDMHHGHGILNKAIFQLNKKDREDFKKFVTKNTSFNPHIMCISKKKILKAWFKDVFNWLFKCEKVFGLKKLKGYDQERLYAYLAERYLSFWFKKYTKSSLLLKPYLLITALLKYLYNLFYFPKKINLDIFKKKNNFLFKKDLNFLFEYFNSDKGEYFINQYSQPYKKKSIRKKAHAYTKFYESYFKNIKNNKLNIIEI